MDLEIINPIESKKILGGDWYNDPTWDLGQLREVYVGGSSSGGGWYDPFGGWGDPWSNNSGSYDYGSGGGSNDGGPGEGKLPSPPNHICTQLNQGTTCATMALSYVANYLGGTGLTSSDFAEMVGNDYLSMLIGMPNPMTNVFSDGLSGAQISTIMSNVFQSTIIDGSTNSLVTNLNSGHPILATIDLGGGNGHEVVIIGFNANAGTVTYMDSLVGGQVTSNVKALTFTSQLYAVTGIQNNTFVNKYKNDTNDSKCGICGH